MQRHNKIASKFNVQKTVIDFLFICFGTAIYAIGLNIFIQPNQLTPGGITGIAVQLNHIFDLPVGVLVLMMNLPLFVFGFIKLGGKFIAGTVVATVFSSVFIDLLSSVLPVYKGEVILSALFGGVVTGFGVSLLYLRGSAMGGSDIISTVVNKRFSFLSIGKISLILNGLVIISSAFVYGNIESALYSTIAAFVSSKMLDVVLLGNDSGKIVFAITENDPYELAEAIHRSTGRGATVIPVTGTYKQEGRSLLLCVAKRIEFSKIHRVIKAFDPQSFVVVGDATEILGNGFKQSK